MSVVQNPDGMTSVRIEIPDLFIDTRTGDIACALCGKIGQAVSQLMTGHIIRTHVFMEHVQTRELDALPLMMLDEGYQDEDSETATCGYCGETYRAPKGHDPLRKHYDYCEAAQADGGHS